MIGLHSLFEAAHLRLDIVDAAERRERSGVDRLIGSETDLLFEKAELYPAGQYDIARVRRFLARQYAKERRLPRAVGADQAHLVARIDLKRNPAQDLMSAVAFSDLGYSEKHSSKGKAKGVIPKGSAFRLV